MIVFCEDCGTRYDVDLDASPGPYHSFHCLECHLLITISKERPTEIISPDVALKNKLVAASKTYAKKKRILVVDDSKLFRRIIRDILESDGTLEVVGEAANGHEALQKNQDLQPDLITLDINMPGMGGTSVLKRFMLTHPCPVVIISNLSNRSQATIIDFLRHGAVDFLVKPRHEQDPEEVRQHYIKIIHDAATAHIAHFRRFIPSSLRRQQTPLSSRPQPCKQLAIILSGAGGIAELFSLFSQLPAKFSATLLVIQTMPQELVSPLVEYLNQICSVSVEPLSGDISLHAGFGYVGTSTPLWELKQQNDGTIRVTVQDSSPCSGKQYGVDTFLRSASENFSDPFTLTLLSGAKNWKLETLRSFQLHSHKIIIKDPQTCMLQNALFEVQATGLADVQASPEDLLASLFPTPT